MSTGLARADVSANQVAAIAAAFLATLRSFGPEPSYEQLRKPFVRVVDALATAIVEHETGISVADAGKAADIRHLRDYSREARNEGRRVWRRYVHTTNALAALWDGRAMATAEELAAIEATFAEYAALGSLSVVVAPTTVDHAAVLRGLHRQMGALIETFARGEAVDACAVEDLGIQIGRYVGTAQAIRDAERAAEPVAAAA